MACEPCDDGLCKVEIDESKIVTYDGNVRWMFGIADRGRFDVRIFFVNDNRSRETLLPIVKKYVNTVPNVIINNIDDMDNPPATRIFSDCWNAYSTSDFNEAGYIHHKINHSVWFGQGSFHTNNIEGIWSKIKRLMDNFNGINGNIFNGKNNINNIDYFNSWICLGIFFMNTEHLQLGINAKKKYLISYLKI